MFAKQLNYLQNLYDTCSIQIALYFGLCESLLLYIMKLPSELDYLASICVVYIIMLLTKGHSQS